MTEFATERRYLHQAPDPIADNEDLLVAPALTFARSEAGDVLVTLCTQHGAPVAQSILMPADVDDLADWMHAIRLDEDEPVEFIEQGGRRVVQVDPELVVALLYEEDDGQTRSTSILLQGGHCVKVEGSIDDVRATLRG